MADNLQKVIYLSNSDYDTLVASGSVTVGGVTITYSDNDIYLTPETVATSSSDGLMSAADKAKLDGIAAGAQVNPSTYLVSATKVNNTLTITNNSNSSITVTYSDIGAAADSTVVHKTGTETINGNKTFSSIIKVENSIDNNYSTLIGNGLQYLYGTTDSVPLFSFSIKDTSTSTTYITELTPKLDQTSNSYLQLPAQGTLTNPAILATTDDIAGKADDSVVVHKTGNETISGLKTFSNFNTFEKDINIGKSSSTAHLLFFAGDGNNQHYTILQPSTTTTAVTLTLPATDGTLAIDEDIVHKGTSSSTGIAETIYGEKTFAAPVVIGAGTSAAQLTLGNSANAYSTYITFASGVSGNTGTLNLYKPSSFSDTYNVTLPERTGVLAEAIQIGSSTIAANDSGVIMLSPNYQHNIVIESSNNLVCSFQFINSVAGAYATGSNLLNALDDLGFDSYTKVCSATGMPYLSSSTTTAMIIGVYSSSSTTLGFRYIPLIVTSNNTTTVNVRPSVQSGTLTITNYTIRDVVVPLF